MLKRAAPATSGRSEIKGAPYRLLVIEARFYEDIADELLAGAVAEIEAEGAGHAVVTVPGALEIPQAFAAALKAGRFASSGAGGEGFHGVVALGCVIRGETGHYDIVANNANHWLMDLATRHAVPVGNAILTCETHAQAMARACGGRAGKGAAAVRACVALLDLARQGEDRTT